MFTSGVLVTVMERWLTKLPLILRDTSGSPASTQHNIQIRNLYLKEIKPFFFTSGISLIASSSRQTKISTYHYPPQILNLRENTAHEALPPHTYLFSPEVLGGVMLLIDSENVWDIASLGSFEQKEGQSLFWAKHCSAAMKKMCRKISLEFLSQS